MLRVKHRALLRQKVKRNEYSSRALIIDLLDITDCRLLLLLFSITVLKYVVVPLAPTISLPNGWLYVSCFNTFLNSEQRARVTTTIILLSRPLPHDAYARRLYLRVIRFAPPRVQSIIVVCCVHICLVVSICLCSYFI